jgi:hypothetical protein
LLLQIIVFSDLGHIRMLTENFTEEYQRDAKALCSGVLGVLRTAAAVSVDDISGSSISLGTWTVH